MADVYREMGFEDREDYLRNLAADYGVDYATVKMMAELLGPNEDFDGLVSEIQDMAD